ncbi:MAG: hypothetical protein DRP93_06280 [Candidatus Neomarinimicrobiota bacterium]|nr:MAG: hypothetical protein DRP93_06280 [Candidatus Neomarinimicrobiota bacterium]
MSLPFQALSQSPLIVQFDSIKFVRRNDLNSTIRFSIAIEALYGQLNNVWGSVTRIAKENNISRSFLYSLMSSLKESGEFLFSEQITSDVSRLSRDLAIKTLLSLRLEGGSSYNHISTMMKRFECKLSSVGSISQILTRIGRVLPMTLSTNNNHSVFLVFASDEIYSKKRPILVSVDPYSSAILRIELLDSCQAENWKKHFECLHDEGIKAIYLVSDDGVGLRAGHAQAMEHTVRQSDTYHAIAHKLGSWVDRLEKRAYTLIKQEQVREKRFDAAKSEAVQNKYFEAWEKTTESLIKAISLYDDYQYLYGCIIEELNVFDRFGDCRDPVQAEEEIKVGLLLMESLKHNKISTAVAKTRRTLPDLFHYFERAKKVVKKYEKQSIDKDYFRALCLAWQWGKAVRKAKNTPRKHYAKEQEKEFLGIVKCLQPKEAVSRQEDINKQLDTIVQSSAMVECINSIIRPFLNTSKDHVTQEQLNLIMYYHNHRRYRAGKRKNKTPMELLTGTVQTDDWISLVFNEIREKDPDLLLAS